MRLAVLFSGGKDSCAAFWIATSYGHEVVCLLTLESENPASYMFHTPNISLTRLQAQAVGIPLLIRETKGEKEEELKDLHAILAEAKRTYRIEGVATGAIASVYQATRIQEACAQLGLWLFNPLWQRDQAEHLRELIGAGFEIVASGVAAYPLNDTWLGRRMDEAALAELEQLQQTYGLNPAGEGGELETLVLWAPGWRKRLVIREAVREYENHAGTWQVKRAELESVRKSGRAPKPAMRGKGDILVVSLCKERLSEREFVVPIIQAVGEPCVVVHHSRITSAHLRKARAIILSGTPLQDDEFLNADFSWLRGVDVPLLGICAGMQAIAKEHGAKLAEKTEIGMTRIVSTGADPSFPIEFEAYALHRHAPTLPNDFTELARSAVCLQAFRKENVAGILFHPEARNKGMVRLLIAVHAGKEAPARRTRADEWGVSHLNT
jgi:diphthine-ammonia ligase